ncbi:hypothetical protein TNIN_346981 [Trichonephila inaurata madagascariensis]|uniref:Uncharacterized protein n=1 Tax=Trichonephila inaurata madagascariensis TaxID=2747483 RepID=A0A8X7CKW1_9ARAC|nr:hypothetical protein TNIN_346981 [Trichonephila inaurata madagascariensis]
MSSRHPKKSPFVVDPSCWSSPLNGRPLAGKNFTTETPLVRRSRHNTSPLCHIDFGLHPGQCCPLFLTKKSIHLPYGRLTSHAAKQARKNSSNHCSQLLKLHVFLQAEGEGNKNKILGLSILNRGASPPLLLSTR